MTFRELTLAVVLVAAPIAAQDLIDPATKIKKIMDGVAEQMQQIDEMLLQSAREPSKAGESAEAIRSTVDSLDELLQQTTGAQGAVIESLSELIQEMEKSAEQQSSSSSQQPPESEQQSQQERDQQQQDRQQGSQPQQQQPSGQRRENQTPDQPRPDGEPQGSETPPGEQPQGGQDSQAPGQNRPAGQASSDGTEEVDREGSASAWGKLPPYLGFLKQYGGTPDVPARYKRLFDAYMKSHTDAGDKQSTRPARRR